MQKLYCSKINELSNSRQIHNSAYLSLAVQTNYLNFTNITYNNLSEQERIAATQRLTALWAFMECGFGGVLHALHMPFTGLLVGGFAVIIITFIAQISGKKDKQILKSLLIVLIVKAMVSPHIFGIHCRKLSGLYRVCIVQFFGH